MKFFDQEALLTTPFGKIIPDVFFYNELDKQTCALQREAQKNVSMYAHNPFYSGKQSSLYDHVGGIMDLYLAMPSVQKILAEGRETNPKLFDIVIRCGRQILMHDDGENCGEGLSFQQKTIYTTLISDTKRLEQYVAPAFYELAACYAATNMPFKFLKMIRPIQTKFKRDLNKLPQQEQKEIYYRKITDKVILKIVGESKHGYKPLTMEQNKLIEKNLKRYEIDLQDCEGKEKSVSGILTKAKDKLCPLYIDHALEVYADPTIKSAPLDEESNSLFLKTIERTEEFLLELAKESEINPDALHFLKDLCEAVDSRAENYTSLGRHFIYPGGNPMPEPKAGGSRRSFNENYFMQKEQLSARRKNNIHPLADKHVMGNTELAAWIKTCRHIDGKIRPYIDIPNNLSGLVLETFDYNHQQILANPIFKDSYYQPEFDRKKETPIL